MLHLFICYKTILKKLKNSVRNNMTSFVNDNIRYMTSYIAWKYSVGKKMLCSNTAHISETKATNYVKNNT